MQWIYLNKFIIWTVIILRIVHINIVVMNGSSSNKVHASIFKSQNMWWCISSYLNHAEWHISHILRTVTYMRFTFCPEKMMSRLLKNHPKNSEKILFGILVKGERILSQPRKFWSIVNTTSAVNAWSHHTIVLISARCGIKSPDYDIPRI